MQLVTSMGLNSYDWVILRMSLLLATETVEGPPKRENFRFNCLIALMILRDLNEINDIASNASVIIEGKIIS